ncbi:MAG: ATP-binding protein, partial [Sutterellaceae bacterium]|nr:ATP-binding protein [Sutterellaceae bacterium]
MSEKQPCSNAFSKDKPSVYFVAKPMDDAELFREFCAAISAVVPTNAQRFADWDKVFLYLAELKERLVVVIDDFQNLKHARPSIDSEIQCLWDHHLQHSNLLLILAGGDTGFFKEKVLSYSAPLYGRAGLLWQLNPLPFVDAVKLMPGFDRQDQIDLYTVLGGVPSRYERVRSDRSVLQNIVDIVFANDTLRDEIQKLSPTQKTILSAVVRGTRTFEELLKSCRTTPFDLQTHLEMFRFQGMIKQVMPALTPFLSLGVSGQKNFGEALLLQ